MPTLQPLVSEALIGGTWTNLTSQVQRDDGNGIRIQRRPLNWGERTDGTQASWIYKNPDNNLYGRNPGSIYYGLLGRNVPVRHRLLMFGDTFDGRTSSNGWGNSWTNALGTASEFAVAANVATHTHTAANALHISAHETGMLDHDIVADMSWAIGTALTAPATQWVAIRYVDTSNYLGAVLSLTTTATVTLQLFKRVGGSLSLLGSAITIGTAHTGGEIWRVRVRPRGNLWYSCMAWRPAVDTEPASWQLGQPITDTATFATATKAALASRLESGNTNTLNVVGTFYSFEANSYRFWGEIPSFSPVRDSTGLHKTVPVSAAGLSQRLGAGARPLGSALTRAMGGISAGDFVPIAHWSLEEPAGATSFGSLVAGVPPATPSGDVVLAGYSGCSGSLPVPTLNAGAQIAGVFPPFTLTPEADGDTIWQYQFVGMVPSSIQGADSTFFEMVVPDTGGDHVVKLRVQWVDSLDLLTLRWYDRSGVQVGTGAALDFAIYGSYLFDRAALYGISVFTSTASPGFVAAQFAAFLPTSVVGPTSPLAFGTNSWTSSVMPIPQSWRAYGSAGNAGWSFSHPALYTDPALFTAPSQQDNANALDGFSTEPSGTRMIRLSREVGIPFELIGDEDDTSPCGAQNPGTYLVNMQAAADADQGALKEARDLLALEYTTRTAMMNPLSRIEYNHHTTHDLEAFQIIDDAKVVRNKITARRTGGSFAIAEITSGPTSTAEFPDGIGEYPEDLSWNVASDDQLLALAGWRALIRGWNEPRYPGSAVWRQRSAIATVPALDAATLALDITDRYTIADLPVDLPPDDVELLVQGYDELLANFEHQLIYDGTAARPYDVATADGTSTRTTDDHFLRTAVNASATSWEIANVNPGMQLIADDAQDGWLWMVEGERVVVTDVVPPSIAFVGVGTASSGASGSRTPGLPASIATGNLALIFASTRNSGTGTADDLANWRTFYRDGNVAVLGRIYDGVWSMPTVTYTGGAANEDTIAQSAAFSGRFHDIMKIKIIACGCLNLSAQDITTPGVPIVGLPENLAAIYLGWKQDDFTSVAAPGSWNELQEASSVAGNDASQVWGYRLFTSRPAAGSLQPAIAVTGGAAAISRGAVLVIASDYQLITVTRSDNGVAKSHGAGAVPELIPAPHVAL